jgi:hypothetical protein
LLYPEGINHNILIIDDRDATRKVVRNQGRIDPQTGKSLVEDGYESIVRPIMSDASAGCADDIVQQVMGFVIEVGIEGLRVGKV